jgi:hypothetical protein
MPTECCITPVTAIVSIGSRSRNGCSANAARAYHEGYACIEIIGEKPPYRSDPAATALAA